ncbi:MAG: CRISPR-associated protein Cas4 [Moheibacter sp.]
MNLTGTHINYYRLCPRKLWLFANDIQMEQTSDLVADGKVIEEESYQHRSDRYTQIELSSEFEGMTLTGKIDFYDTRDKVVHETKRSNKVEQAHIWQVKFYLWLLQLNDIEAEKGVIEYPKLRKTEEVILKSEDITYLEKAVVEIIGLIHNDRCPPVLNAKICKSCSYYDFCYAQE